MKSSPAIPCTILCKCEDITTQEIKDAIQLGHTDIESLKRFTAIGTGMCQGRYCIPQCKTILNSKLPFVEIPKDIVHRPPLTMVSLGDLAGLKSSSDES